MKLSQRRLYLLAAVFLVTLIIITAIAAPFNNPNNRGSTYNRNPDGYGAWYAYMREKGAPINRWKKPFTDIPKQFDSPVTLIRVYSDLMSPFLTEDEEKWIAQNNHLILLGVRQPVTEANYSSEVNSFIGKVKIDTTRRSDKKEAILKDDYGAIVWEKNIDKGKVIYATTPDLAANAYQNYPNNYKFLAQLVNSYEQPILVDEYIHGYKDAEVIKKEAEESKSISEYLWNVWGAAFAQILILILIVIWAYNQRFGQITPLKSATINNTQAYIQALAGVLEKADSSNFIISLIGKEEQLQLQKTLGLGDELLDAQSLINAWQIHRGKTATDLQSLLKIQAKNHPLSQRQLITWLEGWGKIRQSFNEKVS